MSIGTRSALARKAEGLFLNLEDLIERRGLECIGFVTLTFKENLTDRAEAQRRFNSLATHVLRPKLAEFVAAVERQQRGAIHYHLIAAFPFDIRSGFDFQACKAAIRAKKAGDFAGFKQWERVYVMSANPALRNWWFELRDAAAKYGFGRCETLPVLTNGEALGRYVGAYVGTEASRREDRDKGLRTLRYSLDRRAASGAWSWFDGAGRTWRRGCMVLGALLQVDDFGEALGKRWAFYWRKEISAFGRHFERCMAAVAAMPSGFGLPERIATASQFARLLLDWEASAPASRVPASQGAKPAPALSLSVCINSTERGGNEP